MNRKKITRIATKIADSNFHEEGDYRGLTLSTLNVSTAHRSMHSIRNQEKNAGFSISTAVWAYLLSMQEVLPWQEQPKLQFLNLIRCFIGAGGDGEPVDSFITEQTDLF